jgi:hypothetical protein
MKGLSDARGATLGLRHTNADNAPKYRPPAMQIFAAMKDDRRNHRCMEAAMEWPLPGDEACIAVKAVAVRARAGRAPISAAARHAKRIGVSDLAHAGPTNRDQAAVERHAERTGIFR